MIFKCDRESEFKFSVLPPLYMPFYNVWCANAYYKYDAFSYDPFGISCSSTSGSPVVIAGGKFFGFLNESGGSFSYDGKGVLTVKCSAGQELYCNESCDPYEEWLKYNSLVTKNFELRENEDFWSTIEYCTWVDQKREAVQQGSNNMQSCLNEKFVYDYMKRVEKMGLPKGKLTIDDGWDHSRGSTRIYGNWEIDRQKFPNMERLVRDMTDEGFIPGLWFAPFTFTPDCDLAMKYPQLIGNVWQKNSESGLNWMFIYPDPELDAVLEKYYHDIFSYYISMGFRKLKLDISYGHKDKMKKLMKMIYGVVKGIDSTVEV